MGGFSDEAGTAARASAEPQPMYVERAAACPVTHNPNGTVTLLRMEDILTVNRSHDVEQASKYLGSNRKAIPLGLDGPEHTKYRRLLDPVFTARRIAPLEDNIRKLANELIDGFVDDGEVNVNQAWCQPLPSTIFLSILGLPVDDLENFMRFKNMTLGIGMPKDATPEELMELRNEAVEWLQAYFNESLDAREASGDPGDDMIGWLMTTEVEGERLTRENILDILGLLMIAGLDTVASSLACMLSYFARHPDRRAEVLADPLAVARRGGRAAAIRVAGHRRRAHRDEGPRAAERRGDPRRHHDERLVVGRQRRPRLLPRPAGGASSGAGRIPTSRSPAGSTGASARTSPAWSCGSRSRRSTSGSRTTRSSRVSSSSTAATRALRSTCRWSGADARGQLRLHHRGRGLGRLRARQSPVGESGEPRAPARSGRQGQQPHDPHPAGLRQAPREPEVRVVLPDASVRAHRSGRGVGARQDPRRVELGERHGVQPRQSGRLGRPRAARQPRLGVELDPPGVQGVRGQPARRVADAWTPTVRWESRPPRTGARSATR